MTRFIVEEIVIARRWLTMRLLWGFSYVMVAHV
jgi:hypothetical protein